MQLLLLLLLLVVVALIAMVSLLLPAVALDVDAIGRFLC
jgi:hypothetical protein